MNDRIKRLAKTVIYYSPKALRNRFHKKVEARRIKEGLERYKRFKVGKDEFDAILSEIEFDSDVMLHTSLLNIGHVAGGVKFVTETLLKHIDTTRHTLVVSALPYFGSFADYLKEDLVFDARTAPVAMGSVNEKLTRREEARRSPHPTHSVAAIGPDAEEYTGEHHLDETPFGVHSPYYKLIKNNAKVLLVGATMDNVTLVHAIEDMVGEEHPVKDIYAPKRFSVKAITDKGDEVRVVTPYHNPKRGMYRRDIMLDDGLDKGYIRQWKVGDGFIRLIDARAYAEAYIDMMKQGRNLYGRCKKLRPDFKLPL